MRVLSLALDYHRYWEQLLAYSPRVHTSTHVNADGTEDQAQVQFKPLQPSELLVVPCINLR